MASNFKINHGILLVNIEFVLIWVGQRLLELVNCTLFAGYCSRWHWRLPERAWWTLWLWHFGKKGWDQVPSLLTLDAMLWCWCPCRDMCGCPHATSGLKTKEATWKDQRMVFGNWEWSSLASKKGRTSVIQPHTTEFCQQPEYAWKYSLEESPDRRV